MNTVDPRRDLHRSVRAFAIVVAVVVFAVILAVGITAG